MDARTAVNAAFAQALDGVVSASDLFDTVLRTSILDSILECVATELNMPLDDTREKLSGPLTRAISLARLPPEVVDCSRCEFVCKDGKRCSRKVRMGRLCFAHRQPLEVEANNELTRMEQSRAINKLATSECAKSFFYEVSQTF
jgi:hypothetical protein